MTKKEVQYDNFLLGLSGRLLDLIDEGICDYETQQEEKIKMLIEKVYSDCGGNITWVNKKEYINKTIKYAKEIGVL